MNERKFVESIKVFLESVKIADNIIIDAHKEIPYIQENTEYDLCFKPKENQNPDTKFETDLLVYEQKSNVIKPRIIIEAKFSEISTHDAITYSYKAQSHKNVTPFLRYGIMLGNRGHHPLPGRLFRHGSNFDFMISFKNSELTEEEKKSFVKLIKKEIEYSQQMEEMLFNTRSKNRKHYFLLQKELRLE